MKTPPLTIEPLEARIAPAFAAVIELSSLDGLNGFKLSGVAPGDNSGYSVSDAGDVNGDGFGDLIIGSHAAGPHGMDSGASYVVFGKASGFAASLNFSTLDGSNGFKLSGVAAGDYSGISVSAAGDVNDDGFGDLIIGAIHADPNGNNSGATYVVFGKASGFGSNLNLSALDGSNGFKLSGVAANDYSGTSVSDAGDINGDGFGDLIIGANRADPNGNSSGASYVVFGKAGGFVPNLNLSTLNGSNGFTLSSAVGEQSGCSVSAAGDVNGDGFGDIVIGAFAANANGPASGASYVVFGKSAGFEANLNLSTLNGSNGFKLSGVAADDRSGRSVSEAGDLNGDGFGDLIIGAPGADPSGDVSGAAYVVFGKAGGFASNLNLSTLNGSNGFKLSGVAAGDLAGVSVKKAGDLNADGFDDVIIGADRADPNGSGSGASYVVFGKASGFASNLNLSSLDGSNGFTLSGVAVNDFSGKVSAAGDVNGDGYGDLIVGAWGADSQGTDSGDSYVIFGRGIELSISDASASEGNAGAKALRFFVTLSDAGTSPVTVRVATTSGSALAGSDYAPLDTVLTFAPGEISKTVAVAVLGDTLFENNESFSLVVSDMKGGVIKDGTGIGTIVNDDAPPLVGIADASVLEGDGGTNALAFTVSLSAASGLPATVRYASAEGTALSGSDYAALTPGTLTFAPGETTKTITIDVSGDRSIEDHEQLSVALSEANGATMGSNRAFGTILNDDTSLGIGGPADALEGDSGMTPLVFTISLEKASALPVKVNYATADGTALSGSDYAALTPGTLTFAPGETTKTITIDVFGDASIEDHEQLSVVLSEANGATMRSSSAFGTILNDDTSLGIAGPADALEGDSGMTPLVFTIRLEKASALPVKVNYAAADGTALSGSDYAALTPGTLMFAPGETTKTITVDVPGDTRIEDHEQFSVVISEANGSIIGSGTAIATILNDDTSLGITDATLLEGHSGVRSMTFTVTLTAASALPVTVNFASADESAAAGIDYTAVTPGTLTFAPGETSKLLTVDVLGDTVVEASESFSLLLADAINGMIARAVGLGAILDDDVTLVSRHKATFTDVDGESVVIKVSRGELKVEDFTIVPSGLGAQLALVDLSGEPEFAGTDLSIKVKLRSGTKSEDHLAHVGYINATGVDLGEVLVEGDLGQIDAGDDLTPERGLLRLSAQSIGRFGTATQLQGGSLQSDIAGALKMLVLVDGMHDAALHTSGNLASVAITGDVLGSAIRSDGKIGALEITGNLAASAANAAIVSARGALAATSIAKAIAIGAVSVGGSADHAQILAGYDQTGAGVNADASIGAVLVGQNWVATNLVAGVIAGLDDVFGTEDDALISLDNPLIARIGSIVIKGSAIDSGGFVAEEIGAFKSDHTKLALTPGPHNDLTPLSVAMSGKVAVREVGIGG